MPFFSEKVFYTFGTKSGVPKLVQGCSDILQNFVLKIIRNWQKKKSLDFPNLFRKERYRRNRTFGKFFGF